MAVAIIFTKSKEKVGEGATVSNPVLPHPLLHLGSYLKDKGIKVYLIDGQICDEKEEIDKIFDKVNMFGFSVMTMQVTNSLALSDYIKKRDSSKKIIWGGIHPSILPEQTVLDTSVDYVCQREGEECFYELVTEKPIEKIKNLVYKKDGKAIFNPLGDFINPDKLNEPLWDILEVEKYVNDFNIAGMNAGRSFPITVGRGCVFNCTFCINTILGKRWRPLSAEKMVKRIKYLKENYNIQHFNLNDDCFDIDRKRVDDFCKILIKEKLSITWDISARAGQHWTNERMKLIAKAGCKAISIGAESGSQRILDMITKGTMIKDLIFMAKQCNKYGIALISSWMSGLPDETKEEQKQTIELLKKITKICPACSIHGPQPFKPYPNSKLYFEAVKQGFEVPKTLREWSEKSAIGFIEDSSLPWIDNIKRLRVVEFTCMNAFRYPRNFLHKMLIKLSKFRLKYHFYFFPIEIPLTKFYVGNLMK